MERILGADQVRFSVNLPNAAGRIEQHWVETARSVPGDAGTNVEWIP
jgi:hypothetical protein